ncbi:GNAT family N-acetyltransferase [Actinomycetes bacterium M1A6_2h]
MSTLVSTLTLDNFDTLPVHDRKCVFWTMDPAAVEASKGFADPEFEKEAWLSMVMLEWGPCGQVAIRDGLPVGCALYAPPDVVPRVASFPTGPVSHDAVLLTSVRAAVDDSESLQTSLLQSVVRDLVNRGVRALEAFGVRLTEEETDARFAGPAAPRDLPCSDGTCMVESDFLEKFGFEIVAPHHRFPRLRLELDRDHGWKEDVEAALERLLAAAELTVTEADARVPVGAR